MNAPQADKNFKKTEEISMKKALIALLGAGVVAAVASLAVAQDTNSASSANAVGVIKYTIPANGGFTCIALPMNPVDSTQGTNCWIWANTSLASQLPNGSSVYFWVDSRWEQSKKVKNKWNGVGSTKLVEPGEAFFVQSGSSAAEQQISLLGELPTESSLSYGIRGQKNFDTRGVTLYPVETVFADSELASTLDNGSSVFFWVGNRWEQSKKVKNRWNGVGSSYTLSVGEGVFVQSEAAKTVEVERPFEWND